MVNRANQQTAICSDHRGRSNRAQHRLPPHHVLAAKYFVYNGRFCMTSIEAASQDRLAQYGDMSQDPGFGRESWVRIG